MKKLKRCIHHYKVRRLAKRIVAHQLAMASDSNREDVVRSAIATAKTFYRVWDPEEIELFR